MTHRAGHRVATIAAMALVLATTGSGAIAQASRPVFTIVVDLPGASPERVERDVTIPIEQAVNGIAGVGRIRSNTSTGRSSSEIEFAGMAEADAKADAVREAVARLRNRLPPEAASPVYGCTTRPTDDQ